MRVSLTGIDEHGIVHVPKILPTGGRRSLDDLVILAIVIALKPV